MSGTLYTSYLSISRKRQIQIFWKFQFCEILKSLEIQASRNCMLQLSENAEIWTSANSEFVNYWTCQKAWIWKSCFMNFRKCWNHDPWIFWKCYLGEFNVLMALKCWPLWDLDGFKCSRASILLTLEDLWFSMLMQGGGRNYVINHSIQPKMYKSSGA